ncbi:MAG: hypothetical protein ACYTCU_07870, partial [Planctomycetota bacterium]
MASRAPSGSLRTVVQSKPRREVFMGRFVASTAAAALAAAVLGSCAAPESRLASVESPVLPGGTYHVDTWSVAHGATAWFDQDVTIEAEGEIRIDGSLVGIPRPVDSDVSRGADLVLRSETRIVISGEVIGAPGRHGSLHPKALALIGHDPHTYAGTADDATELLVRFLGGRGDEGLDVSFLAGGRGG